MSRWSRFVPVCAIAALLAGCGGGGSDTPLAPASVAAPRYDGGLGTGTNATGSNPADPSTTTVQSDTTNRGGGLGVGTN
jgi:hypothetical protein